MPAHNVVFTGHWIPGDSSPNEVTSYTVRHYVGGVLTETSVFNALVGETVTASPIAFTGCSYNSALSSSSGTVLADNGLVLEMYYDINTYSIAYVLDGSTYLLEENVAFGTSKTVEGEPTPNPGTEYVFSGWSSTDCSVSGGTYIMPDKNVTFIGSWIEIPESSTAAQFSVKHYLADSASPFETDEFTGIAETTVTVYPKTLKGYYSNIASSTGSISEDGSTVFEFRYYPNIYSIKYFINGVQQLDLNDDGAVYGTTKSVASAPSKTGFVFSGWSSTDCIVSGGTYVMPDNDVTFTGSWIPEENIIAVYIVEHYLNLSGGGTLLKETSELKGIVGTAVAATPKTGYTGYIYNSALSASSGTVIENADGAALVLTLYYDPVNNPVAYSVSGDIPPGAPSVPATISYDFGSTVPLEPNLAFPGYTFSWWFSEDAIITGGEFIMPNQGVAITGIWIKNPDIFTVLFNNWDGTTLKTDYVPYGRSATAPNDPSRAGYTFAGWNIAYNYITEDIIVTALYRMNTSDDNDNGSTSRSSALYTGDNTGIDLCVTIAYISLGAIILLLVIYLKQRRRQRQII